MPGGGSSTITVVLAKADPPAPVQVMPYVIVPKGEMGVVPEAARGPVHAPEAVHDVASVDDHWR